MKNDLKEIFRIRNAMIDPKSMSALIPIKKRTKNTALSFHEK